MGPDNRKNLAVFKEIKKKLGKTKLYLMNALCSQNKGAGYIYSTHIAAEAIILHTN